MTIDLLDADEEGIDFGDAHVMKLLEDLHLGFKAGDKTTLFAVIAICARYQAVIPEWATDEILAIQKSLKKGDMKDFNQAFGWAGENLANRKKKARLEKYKTSVLTEMQNYRLKGDSLNADDIFQTIAEDLKIPRRDVEDIYKMHGQFIKELPRGNPENVNYGIAIIEHPPPRRRGRAIFKD